MEILPELAVVLDRIASIVREQERRVDGDDTTGSGLSDAPDDALYAALHDAGTEACGLIRSRGLADADRRRARAYLRSTLISYADEVAHAHRVAHPAERAAAQAAVERAARYAQAVIVWPVSCPMLDALDAVESAAARHRTAHDADAHMATLDAVADAVEAVREMVPVPAAASVRDQFVVLLDDYLSVRAGRVPYRGAVVSRVAAALDEARQSMVSMYAVASAAPDSVFLGVGG